MVKAIKPEEYYLPMGEGSIAGIIPSSIIPGEEIGDSGLLVKREDMDNLKKLIRHVKTIGFAINYECDNTIYWMYWTIDEEKENDISCMGGEGHIRNKVLMLLPYKVVKDEDKYKSKQEIINDLHKLPKWNKTKYYVKMMDSGPMYLTNVETGEDINTNKGTEGEKIMLSLGFHRFS